MSKVFAVWQLSTLFAIGMVSFLLRLDGMVVFPLSSMLAVVLGRVALCHLHYLIF